MTSNRLLKRSANGSLLEAWEAFADVRFGSIAVGSELGSH